MSAARKDVVAMAIERTLSIIKPNAVKKDVIGEIITRMEKKGLRMIAAKMIHLTREKAEGFYIEHQNKPFFPSLVHFMTSGPILVMVLEGENAIQSYRDLMGVTDPAKAAMGTIRKDYGDTMQFNAVHGSDSLRSAEREVAYFFEHSEICQR